MIKKTFKRCENKYLLNSSQYEAVMHYLPLYMKADEYSEHNKYYTIYNIYYDTNTNDIIRNSINKPYYKEKLRLRSYRIPTQPDDIVFLELKKKIGKEVSKRRASMSLSEAEKFIQTGVKPSSSCYVDNQVTQEISQFLNTHKVSPKVFISYHRMAYVGSNDSDFRVTFDSSIITKQWSSTLDSTETIESLLDKSQYLMEVKVNGAIPLWMTHIFAANNIYSTSFSKYGTAYKKYCMQNSIPDLQRKEKCNA